MSVESPTQAVLTARSIEMSFGAQPVLSGVSLTVHEGDRIGLIGRNGSGKSTLLRIIAGLETPYGGSVARAQGLRVALLSQTCRLDTTRTVGEVLHEALGEVKALRDEHASLTQKLAQTPHDAPEHAEVAASLSVLQHELEITSAWNLEQDVKKISLALNTPATDRRLDTLSGGELRRVDLAATVLRKPDLLLLDEPTNHIDTRSVEWVERFLETYAGTCILVTHDRYFLDRVVNRIVELEFGKLLSYSGNYNEFLEKKAERQEQLDKAETSRQIILRRELAWLRRGAKARSTKQKARIGRYHDLDAQGPPDRHKDFAFEIPEANRLGKRIVEVEDAAFGYDGDILFKGVNLIMQKDMRVGIVGPNGCGKTSLLRVLMGELAPTAGSVFISDGVDFLYVDQSHEEIHPDTTILNFVSHGQTHLDIGGKRMYVPAYLERFLFDINSVDMPMQNLSGGERNRIDLARKLLKGGNFLVLDEPTNDLDLATLRLLEEAVNAFDGCALIVSHDRYFLNRLCTHMLVFEGEGRVVLIAGNYDNYVIYKRAREEEASEETPGSAETRKPVRQQVEEPKPRRLTWREKKELESMEEAILETEEAVRALEEQAAAPGFYEQEYQEVQVVLKELESTRAKVETLYARWQELENIAEGQA